MEITNWGDKLGTIAAIKYWLAVKVVLKPEWEKQAA
jgi:hypothetical protein